MPNSGLTKDCPKCGGSGELVRIEKDGATEAVTGVVAMKRLQNGWEHAGVKGCRNCVGYGHVDAVTGEI